MVEDIRFYAWSQTAALSTFLPLLHPHLPYSNPFYNRIRAPHNVPARHCLFASTFRPGTGPEEVPELYTMIFADRSRKQESQIWIFNPLITYKEPLSSSETHSLRSHILESIMFLKNTRIPEAPGWPFEPRLKFAMVHKTITTILLDIVQPLNAVMYITRWNTWLTKASTVSSTVRKQRELPKGYSLARIPEDQLGLVVSTSEVPRQASTLLLQPSLGVFTEKKELVAWGYVGIDGSFATLYVMPEQRGNGFASIIAVELLKALGSGEFRDLGYDGTSDWVHSDVKPGNVGSESVMKSIGAQIWYESSYIHIDSDLF